VRWCEDMRSNTLICTHKHAHMRTFIHIYMSSITYIYTHKHTHTYIHSHVHMHTCSQGHACDGPRTLVSSSTAHPRTHVYTCTHAHRPCVRWSEDISAEHFVYDLVCMRYNEYTHELHFWSPSVLYNIYIVYPPPQHTHQLHGWSPSLCLPRPCPLSLTLFRVLYLCV
jgi:hypothetical protein